METVSLTELLGRPVRDSAGAVGGRVREVAITPQEDRNRVSSVIVKTKSGDRIVPLRGMSGFDGRSFKSQTPPPEWNNYSSPEGLLLLGRDLLDQQIIDVHGRKVVRVNDAELVQDASNGHISLRIAGVDVGPRGAVRRLLRGVVPRVLLRYVLNRIPPRVIPWEYVDLIETDPARRVHLKVSLDGLSRMHPAEIADIVEDLPPAEREAIFETLDEHVAADALEEVDPKMQVAIVNSLDSDKAADIVEEMDPDAAANLLADLPPERSEEILQEMQPEEREEVAELLSHSENTAAGHMTTDYMALPETARVGDAVEQLRNFEGGVESVSTVFLTSPDGKLVGAVPLSRLLLSRPDDTLTALATERVISVPEKTSEREVAETFDKYNLLTLPVVDENGVLTGVITADDIISLLRSKS
jgi:magnesium transporter